MQSGDHCKQWQCRVSHKAMHGAKNTSVRGAERSRYYDPDKPEKRQAVDKNVKFSQPVFRIPAGILAQE